MKGLAEIPMRLVVFTLLALSLAIPVLAQDPEVIEGKPVVLDGDTLMFGDQRVRLWGIDAPEMSDWPWGAYARATLDAIFSAKPVRCEVTGKDGSGLVARCFTPEAVDLGAAVIAAGWAIRIGCSPPKPLTHCESSTTDRRRSPGRTHRVASGAISDDRTGRTLRGI